ncbi:Hemicentin-2, partial [Trichinella pseudospiralis]
LADAAKQFSYYLFILLALGFLFFFFFFFFFIFYQNKGEILFVLVCLFVCIVVVWMRVQSSLLHLRSVLLVLLFLLTSLCGPGNDAAKASSRRSRGRGKNLLPFANVAEHSLLSQTADQERSVKIIKASHFNQAFRLGGKIAILCTAAGYPRPTITWYKDGVELVFKNNVHVQEQQHDDEQKQTSRIEIDPATMGDQGIYTCLAHNERGSIVKNFKSEFYY